MVPVYRRTPKEEALMSAQYTSGGIPIAPEKTLDTRIATDLIGDATFELTQDGDMTILNFGHRNWKEPVEFMAHCSMKWAVFLMSLRELVETGKGKPAPEDLKIDNWN